MRLIFLTCVQFVKSPAPDESETMMEDDESRTKGGVIESLGTNFMEFRNDWIEMEIDIWNSHQWCLAVGVDCLSMWRTKHVDVKIKCTGGYFQKELVDMEYIQLRSQLADILTKKALKSSVELFFDTV